MRTSLLGVGILMVACGGNSDVSFDSAGAGGGGNGGAGGSDAGSSQGGSAQGGSAGSAQGGTTSGGNAGSAQGGTTSGGNAGSAQGGSQQGGSAGQAQGGSAGLGGSAGSGGGAAGSSAGGSAGTTSVGGSAGMSSGGAGGGGSLDGLLMSEYVEGSMANKAIELFNGTSGRIDLTRCELVFSFAGSTNQQHIPLVSPPNGLASKATWVVCNGAASEALRNACDQPLVESPSQQYFWFNGDDTVELFCDGSLVDSLGKLGEDPGEGWGDPNSPTYTRDHTLRRKCSVTQGDTNSGDSFIPTTEWEGFGLDQIDGLGHHCGT